MSKHPQILHFCPNDPSSLIGGKEPKMVQGQGNESRSGLEAVDSSSPRRGVQFVVREKLGNCLDCRLPGRTRLCANKQSLAATTCGYERRLLGQGNIAEMPATVLQGCI